MAAVVVNLLKAEWLLKSQTSRLDKGYLQRPSVAACRLTKRAAMVLVRDDETTMKNDIDMIAMTDVTMTTMID